MSNRRGRIQISRRKKVCSACFKLFKLFLFAYCAASLFVIRNLNISDYVQVHSESLSVIESDHKTEIVELPESVIRRENRKVKNIIAYAISLTNCPGKRDYAGYVEGASVLRHSIHLNSFENFESSGSLYSYKLIAFVHTEARHCSNPLSDLGFEVIIKDTPIDVKNIKGHFLRSHVWKTGCCGDKEFLKLYAYTLLDYPVVVHLDMDALILKPFDDLFDAMIEGKDEQKKKLQTMFKNVAIPEKIDAYFTNDYFMKNSPDQYPGVQGGFLVIRPNIDVYNKYIETILEGNFYPGSGWGGLGYGGYYGAQQIQGLVSYFYGHLRNGTAVELNRCIYNNMNDDPMKRFKWMESCTTGKKTCEDCRKKKLEEIKSIHFTVCPKPWTCAKYLVWARNYDVQKALCRQFHREWFRVRRDFEDNYILKLKSEWKSKRTVKSSNFYPDHFFGFCEEGGEANYIPIN